MKNCGIRRFHHSSFFILHSSRLFQIVAAINDAGVEEGGGFLPQRHRGTEVLRTATIALTPDLSRPTGEGDFFRSVSASLCLGGRFCFYFLSHAGSLRKKIGCVNFPLARPGRLGE